MRLHWLLSAFALTGVLVGSLASGPTQSPQSRTAAKSLALLQHSSAQWYKTTACVSCHHHSLMQVAGALAVERGVPIDRAKLQVTNSEVEKRTQKYLYAQLEGTGAINGSAGFSYKLFGEAAAKTPQSDYTDAAVYYLLSHQSSHGNWPSLSHRPPLETSSVTLTALAIKGLRTYARGSWRKEANEAVGSARSWLMKFDDREMEETSFKLFGLAWSGAPSQAIRNQRNRILSFQHADGGWSQLAGHDSDPYATGQALVALNAAGGLDVSTDAYRRGVGFLLKSQQTNGSWRVATRRRSPGLPYFETGFPHKANQFISFAGTAWASMALALSERQWRCDALMSTTVPSGPTGKVKLATDTKVDRLLRAALSGSLEDLRSAVRSGAPVNGRGVQGATALMYAARDPRKVQLLLESGANPNLVSKNDSNALIIAAGCKNANESIRLLLAAGAKVDAVRDQYETPLAMAAIHGDLPRMKMLMKAGADPSAEIAAAAVMAESAQDALALELLVKSGVDVNTVLSKDSGDTLLSYAIFDGSLEMVEKLLELGSDPNMPVPGGLTFLGYAAMIDPGHTKIIEALIRSGAVSTIANKNGKSPLSLAKKYGNRGAVAILEKQR